MKRRTKRHPTSRPSKHSGERLRDIRITIQKPFRPSTIPYIFFIIHIFIFIRAILYDIFLSLLFEFLKVLLKIGAVALIKNTLESTEDPNNGVRLYNFVGRTTKQFEASKRFSPKRKKKNKKINKNKNGKLINLIAVLTKYSFQGPRPNLWLIQQRFVSQLAAASPASALRRFESANLSSVRVSQ